MRRNHLNISGRYAIGIDSDNDDVHVIHVSLNTNLFF